MLISWDPQNLSTALNTQDDIGASSTTGYLVVGIQRLIAEEMDKWMPNVVVQMTRYSVSFGFNP
jgi:hypothetical protein